MRLSRTDHLLLAGGAAALALAAAVVGAPLLLLRGATAQARDCLELPGTDHPPTCSEAEASLAQLAAIPWVRHDATYRYEELRARRALALYDEAIVASPDPVARARAAETIGVHEDIVEKGSGRIRLEELGAPVPTPDAGSLALLRGDRDTLLLRWDHVGLWSVRVAALRAAFLEGDLDRADAMAARYAEFDPRDGDLRTTVAATLCLGPEPARGLELLARVPADRAGERHAAIARNWGEVRLVQEACADLASIEPPAMPIERHAGVPDAVEARAVQALRLARGEVERADAVREARALLRGEPAPAGAGLSARTPHARAALLAQLLEADASIEAHVAVDLARPRAGDEAPLRPDAGDPESGLQHEPGADAPWVDPTIYAAASRRLESLARAASEDDGRALRDAAAALALHAAAGFARVGDGAQTAAPMARLATLGEPRDAALLRHARWTALTQRGRAPADLTDWVAALARLVPADAPEGATEVWLDAALALDGSRFSLRQMAGARAAAARARGDAASADAWERRLVVLRALLRDPRRAVIARFLGI